MQDHFIKDLSICFSVATGILEIGLLQDPGIAVYHHYQAIVLIIDSKPVCS